MKVWLLGLEQSIGIGFWKNVLLVCWGDFLRLGLLTNVPQRLYCGLCGRCVPMFVSLMSKMVFFNLNSLWRAS